MWYLPFGESCWSSWYICLGEVCPKSGTETGVSCRDPGSIWALEGITKGGNPGNLALTWSANEGWTDWGNFIPPGPKRGKGSGRGGSLGTGRPSLARRSAWALAWAWAAAAWRNCINWLIPFSNMFEKWLCGAAGGEMFLWSCKDVSPVVGLDKRPELESTLKINHWNLGSLIILQSSLT